MTSYGLAVEHYQKDEVIWSGQGGTNVFYQNERAYGPPGQSAWMASPTQDGCPAFLVTPNVRAFLGYGLGGYIVFIDTTATLFDAEAFQPPDRPGVPVPERLRRLDRRVRRLQLRHQRGRRSGDLDECAGNQNPQDVASYP